MNLLPILLGLQAPPPMHPLAKRAAQGPFRERNDEEEEDVKILPIEFVVPGVPVPKGRPIFARVAGRVITRTPPETVAHENTVGWLAKQAMRHNDLLFPGAVGIDMLFVFPIPPSWTKTRKQLAIDGLLRPAVRPDLDNCAKLIMDAMNGVVFRDDGQVTELVTRKRYGESPCSMVRVWPLNVEQS